MNSLMDFTDEQPFSNLGVSAMTAKRTPLERATLYLETGLVAQAAEIFDGIVEEAGDPEARMGLARCAYMRGDLHEALGHLQQLQQQHPEFPGVENDLGVIYFELGLFKQAREQLELTAENQPDDPVIWRNLIDVAGSSGDKEACKDYCLRLLALEPMDHDVRELLEELERTGF